MTDNTTLNSTSGGDTVRDLDRGAGIKTQVVQLDLGGAAANAEVLITAGQATGASSVPVVVASDQDAGGQIRVANLMQALDAQTSIGFASDQGAGFVPAEIPLFLVGG